MRVKRIRIPQKRIGAAIGVDGKVKERIENKTATKINFDGETGEVTVKADDENPLQSLVARDVLKAIGRGFNPERAFRLFDEGIYLSIMDIGRYAGTSKKARDRLKGRLIGRNGKTRRLIEEKTGADLSIYGKTVASIGTPGQLEIVRESIGILLDGAPHSAVYNFLEGKKKKAKK